MQLRCATLSSFTRKCSLIAVNYRGRFSSSRNHATLNFRASGVLRGIARFFSQAPRVMISSTRRHEVPAKTEGRYIDSGSPKCAGPLSRLFKCYPSGTVALLHSDFVVTASNTWKNALDADASEFHNGHRASGGLLSYCLSHAARVSTEYRDMRLAFASLRNSSSSRVGGQSKIRCAKTL